MSYRLHSRRPRLSILVDPRFSGGTSAAVARELYALANHVDLRVFALETRMFKGRFVNPRLQTAMDDLGLELVWNPKTVRDEFVVIHNPSCLKFNHELDLKIICDTAYVVTHENFTRPLGGEGFDVQLCLGLLERSLLCRRRFLSPVSGYNCRNVLNWVRDNMDLRTRWHLTEFFWFNICDFPMLAPTANPRDRRGRLSRAGFEKFPDLETMQRHFPKHAEKCSILGGDSFLLDPSQIPDHWEVLPFGATSVEEFFEGFDFFVYYTHPLLQESFGRVIAEAISAGKVVITDNKTAETFGDAVIASHGHDLDEIIAGFVADPERYQRFVSAAQLTIARFAAEPFVEQALTEFRAAQERAHDLF